MSYPFLNNEIDSMFDNEINDSNNDTLLSDKLLCSSDNLSMTSTDLFWDLNYDDMHEQYYDSFADKHKENILDFECNLSDYNYVTEPIIKNPIKHEPTYTNSVSSSYMTDECSPTSSSNNSPIGRKVKKREFQSIYDSSSEKSFGIVEDSTLPVDHSIHNPPFKSAKTDIQNHYPVKEESITQCPQQPRTIYKVSRREPIVISSSGNYGNGRSIVKIRQSPSGSIATTTGTASAVPLIVTGSIKSVNISKYHQNHFENNSSNRSNSTGYSPLIEHQDGSDNLLTGEFYDHEIDLYSANPTGASSTEPLSRKSYGALHSNGNHGNNNHHNNHRLPLFQTPIPQSGTLYLTEEEKRTFIQENYPIPTRLPLTKQDDRNLKKVRRKIKNKWSAQESRRKKKEYIDALEKKVEAYEQERLESKRRIETLENQQRTLQNQIRHYQQQMMNKITGTGNTTSTGIMLFMICFALILVGGSVPSSYRKMNPPQSSLISSASLYYMGYGPSRSLINNSHNSLYQDSIRNKPDTLLNQRTPPNIDIITPRQSILLGEDTDDRNFEDLVLSYRNTKNRICDGNYLIESAVNFAGMVKNNDSIHPRKKLLGDTIIAHLSNINIVK